MTTNRDLDRLLDAWFAEGPLEVADRVIEDVADRIEREPQRPAWRLRGRPLVNTYAKLAAGLAAVIVLAVAGWQLRPESANNGSSPPPRPSPTAAGTAVPKLPDGPVAAGTYRFNPLTSDLSLEVLASVPAGWQGFGSFSILGPTGTGAPSGVGIGFVSTAGLYRDPCHWDLKGDHSWPQAGDVNVGPSVDDLVRALKANTAYSSTEPTSIRLAGFNGTQLELQLPSDIGSCDTDSGGSSRYMVFVGVDGGLYAQGPSNRMRLSIIDVDGTRLIAVVTSYAGTPAAASSAAQGILDSLVISH